MTTYGQLRNDVPAWANNESVELQVALDTIIKLAELRIYRELDLRIFRKSSGGTTEAGNFYVPLPDDCLVVRQLRLLGIDHLANRDETYIREFWPDPGQLGRPRYYAPWNEHNLIVAPTPDQGYPLEIVYTRQPEGIGPDNQSTWLSRHAYDLLLYACLLETAGFLEGVTAERMEMYQTRYGDAAQRVQAQDSRNRSDDFITRSQA
jgi:hypothetical protein